MTPHAVLLAARAVLADPARFTRATRSTVSGVYTLDGALWAAPHKRTERAPFFAAKALLLDVMRRRGFSSLREWERGGSHEMALAIYDEAVAMAGEKR